MHGFFIRKIVWKSTEGQRKRKIEPSDLDENGKLKPVHIDSNSVIFK